MTIEQRIARLENLEFATAHAFESAMCAFKNLEAAVYKMERDIGHVFDQQTIKRNSQRETISDEILKLLPEFREALKSFSEKPTILPYAAFGLVDPVAPPTPKKIITKEEALLIENFSADVGWIAAEIKSDDYVRALNRAALLQKNLTPVLRFLESKTKGTNGQ